MRKPAFRRRLAICFVLFLFSLAPQRPAFPAHCNRGKRAASLFSTALPVCAAVLSTNSLNTHGTYNLILPKNKRDHRSLATLHKPSRCPRPFSSFSSSLLSFRWNHMSHPSSSSIINAVSVVRKSCTSPPSSTLSSTMKPLFKSRSAFCSSGWRWRSTSNEV